MALTKAEKANADRRYYAAHRRQIIARTKKWRIAHCEQARKTQKARRRQCPEIGMLNAARKRARQESLPFDLVRSDIQIPKVCPIFCISLMIHNEKPGDGSPSLDRIIPSKGYVKNNVRVISYRANRIKNDGTLHELQLLVKDLEKCEQRQSVL